MLTATLTGEVLENITAAPTTLKSDELVSVSSDGLSIRATDKSRSVTVEIWVSSEAFESYSAEAFEIGIDFSKVEEFLHLVEDTAIVRIEIDGEQDWITLSSDGVSYQFPSLDTRGILVEDRQPDSDTSAEATLSGRTLNTPLNLAEIAGARVRLSIDSTPTTFSGVTDGFDDSFYFEFDTEDITQATGSADAPPVALDYFTPIQQAIPADTVVQLGLQNPKDVRLQYPIADGSGTVTVWFAGLAT